MKREQTKPNNVSTQIANEMVATCQALMLAPNVLAAVQIAASAIQDLLEPAWLGYGITVTSPYTVKLPPHITMTFEQLLPSLELVTRRKNCVASRLNQSFGDLRICLVMKLHWQNQTSGYIILGPPTRNKRYTIMDQRSAMMVANQLALVLAAQHACVIANQFNDQLSRAVQQATQQLRTSNRRLRELDASKDEFVSMASHQLRTPLTSVKGYLSMVLEGDAGEISATQRTFLTEAYTSSERMVQLIGNFLNVSRIRTGNFTIDLRPGNVDALVAQSIESIQPIAERHHLRINYLPSGRIPLLLIDENKLRQVIINYIDNAIYYSPGSELITVRLYVKDDWVVCTVQDRGIGVPQGEQSKLFTKFFRAHNAQVQRPDGTGIGLFLAKKIVLGHKGELIFRSREGQGSTFGFRLPIKLLTPSARTKTNAKN